MKKKVKQKQKCIYLSHETQEINVRIILGNNRQTQQITFTVDKALAMSGWETRA